MYAAEKPSDAPYYLDMSLGIKSLKIAQVLSVNVHLSRLTSY